MKSMKYLARSATMVPLGIFALAAGGSLATTEAAWAVTPSDEVCMQRAFMGPNATLTSANSLNCSANDIRIARATKAVTRDENNNEVELTTCTRGQKIDLEAEFEVIVTANSRYDTTFFFRKDGKGNARGDGTETADACRVEGLDVPPGLDLDRDAVGDLNSGSYLVTVEFKGVECKANAEGKLLLPNCTSWHSNSSTVAGATDVYTWDPETKSKCRCDDGFFLNVEVEEPAIKVVKTASPTMVDEDTGGAATFTITVTNENLIESVDISSMVDYRWQPGNNPVSGTPTLANVFAAPAGFVDDTDSLDFCWELQAADKILGPGASLTCKFDDSVNGGQAGQKYVNTVKVVGYQVGTGAEVKGEDTADITLKDVPPVPALTKTAYQVKSCSVEVEYQVVVTNNSGSDGITVDSLNDDKFGDITQKQGQVTTPCDISGWGEIAAAGDMKSCSFTAVIQESDCDFTHVNRVTAGGTDDDGVALPDTLYGDAIVEVEQLKPAP